CGCNAVGGGGGGGPHVEIHSVSVDPTTVGDGAPFTVNWQVAYNNDQGVFTELGLYVGMAGDLSTADGRDRRRLFALADTGGAPNHPGSSASCMRSGDLVKCMTGAGVTIPKGATTLTFRLCSENVLNAA